MNTIIKNIIISSLLGASAASNADLIENDGSAGSVQDTTKSALAVICGVGGGNIEVVEPGANDLIVTPVDNGIPLGLFPRQFFINDSPAGTVVDVPTNDGAQPVIQVEVIPDGGGNFVLPPGTIITPNSDGVTFAVVVDGDVLSFPNLDSGATAGDANNTDLNAVCAEFNNLQTTNRPSLAISGEEIAAQRHALVTLQAGHLRNIKTRLVGLRYAAGQYNSEDFKSSYDGTNGADTINLVNESRWGVFSNLISGFGRRSESDFERGFHQNSKGLTSGIDYVWDENFIAGLSVGFNKVDLNFDAGDNGGLETHAVNTTLYGSYFAGKFYIDGSLGYSLGDIETERRIFINGGTTNRTATGDTKSNSFLMSIGTGYDNNKGLMGYGFYGQLNWLDATIDGYTEKGAGGLNLVVDEQDDISSLTSVIGTTVSYAFNTSYGVFAPAARLEWVHEFNNGKRTIDSVLAGDATNTVISLDTDDVDSNYFTFGVGGSMTMENGSNVFADFEMSLGDSDFENYVVTVGIRGSF
ncbi:MAG: autotransporter outer membrane beta-barrel domain-containing protein [Methylococcales bacterium]|jgi:outer membrane lipase/esterase|nr:autotransporter outer membrane beta-barrel domain-containing protein [Methylococcales bacterium]